MQNHPEAKKQAAALRAYLKEVGLELKHQDSLEAVAKVMGFKNWKTMSAALPSSAVRPPEQAVVSQKQRESSSIPGPEDGTLFSVPVTVEVTETALVRVRAYSAANAIERALEHAENIYPLGFVADEGNTRSGDDFYCPDTSSVEVVEAGSHGTALEDTPALPALGVSDFDADSRNGAENSGMRGEFWVDTHDGLYRLYAELNPLEPDNSDDNLRSQCELLVRLEYSLNSDNEGNELASVTSPYEYHGSDYMRSAHLEGMFEDGELLQMLYQEMQKRTNVPL